ncbi:hypothetical protein VIGAN_07012900, partial [Vigna angularis var. angularis]
ILSLNSFLPSYIFLQKVHHNHFPPSPAPSSCWSSLALCSSSRRRDVVFALGIPRSCGVKYEEVRGEARQGVRMMNLLSSVPTQTTRKPFGTMSALLEAEEDFLHGSCYTSEILRKPN